MAQIGVAGGKKFFDIKTGKEFTASPTQDIGGGTKGVFINPASFSLSKPSFTAQKPAAQKSAFSTLDLQKGFGSSGFKGFSGRKTQEAPVDTGPIITKAPTAPKAQAATAAITPTPQAPAQAATGPTKGAEAEITTTGIPFSAGISPEQKEGITNLVGSGRKFNQIDARNFAFATGQENFQQFIGKTGEEAVAGGVDITPTEKAPKDGEAPEKTPIQEQAEANQIELNETEKQIRALEDLLIQLTGKSAEELEQQQKQDQLAESTEAGLAKIEEQQIPLEFIRGQSAALERRALAKEANITRELSRLQEKRQAGIDTAVTTLNITERRAAREAPAEAKTTTNITEFNLAQDQGFKGSFLDFLSTKAAAGRAPKTGGTGKTQAEKDAEKAAETAEDTG